MRGQGCEQIDSIAELSGLSRTRPGHALAMAVMMFSLAGIPPFLGFNAKLAVFDAAVNAGLFPLAVAGIVGSVIGAYYYLRIVKVMYFDDPAPVFEGRTDVAEGGLLTLSTLFLSPLGWILLPGIAALSLAAARPLF